MLRSRSRRRRRRADPVARGAPRGARASCRPVEDPGHRQGRPADQGRRARRGEGAQGSSPAQAGAQAPEAKAPPQPEAKPAGSWTPACAGEQQAKNASPMSRLRKTIATRLKEAQNTAAILTTFNDVDMSAVIDARARYKDLFEKKHGIRLGFMGFFVKAVALAARDVPSVNASLEGDEIVYHDYLDVSVAVSSAQGAGRPGGPQRRRDELRRDRAGDRRVRQEGQGRHARARRHEGRHLHHLQRRRVRVACCRPRSSTRRSRRCSACTGSRSGRWSRTARSSSAR